MCDSRKRRRRRRKKSPPHSLCSEDYSTSRHASVAPSCSRPAKMGVHQDRRQVEAIAEDHHGKASSFSSAEDCSESHYRCPCERNGQDIGVWRVDTPSASESNVAGRKANPKEAVAHQNSNRVDIPHGVRHVVDQVQVLSLLPSVYSAPHWIERKRAMGRRPGRNHPDTASSTYGDSCAALLLWWCSSRAIPKLEKTMKHKKKPYWYA